MPTDYPDYTELMQIIGSDIMVPIDMQAAYIMMPVDIQAQYLTLEIDIVAQSVGNIAIDLAATSIGNVGIDIKAATIGNLTIDIETQSVGVYLQPDWQAKEGKDKAIRALNTSAAFAEYALTDYQVPTGKKLYITSFSASSVANNAADADKQQTIRGHIVNTTDNIFYAYCGGNAGFALSFPVPIIIPADKTVRVYIEQNANHTSSIRCIASGYEI